MSCTRFTIFIFKVRCYCLIDFSTLFAFYIKLGKRNQIAFFVDIYWIIFIILGIMVLTVIGFYLYKKFRKIN